jgi:release factor glutamine methyltransferase
MLLREVISHAVEKLTAAGIENLQVDVELLVGHVLGMSRGEVQTAVISDAEISDEKLAELNSCFGRRFAREPLQHITGIAHFRQLELYVGPGVFIPRPETESVVQLAIDELRSLELPDPVAVDLGTGSGAIALAMHTEVPNAKVFAVEKSPEAHAYTVKNFARYPGAELQLGDLADCFNALNGSVSVVVSNPPYIPVDMVPVDPEVHLFDPSLALYGGIDGMDVIRVVSATAKRLLRDNGALIVEHADSQSAQVCELLLADGWREVAPHKDLTDRYRSVIARK